MDEKVIGLRDQIVNMIKNTYDVAPANIVSTWLDMKLNRLVNATLDFALEEAAKVADTHAVSDNPLTGEVTAIQIAAFIRAMKVQ